MPESESRVGIHFKNQDGATSITFTPMRVKVIERAATITWTLQGTNNVAFDKTDGPAIVIHDWPHAAPTSPDDHSYTVSYTNQAGGTYKYDVKLKYVDSDGSEMHVVIDPEIQNDPPPGDDDDVKGKKD